MLQAAAIGDVESDADNSSRRAAYLHCPSHNSDQLFAEPTCAESCSSAYAIIEMSKSTYSSIAACQSLERCKQASGAATSVPRVVCIQSLRNCKCSRTQRRSKQECSAAASVLPHYCASIASCSTFTDLDQRNEQPTPSAQSNLYEQLHDNKCRKPQGLARIVHATQAGCSAMTNRKRTSSTAI
eukprot:20978-Heterococcus_DN1.PRE.1